MKMCSPSVFCLCGNSRVALLALALAFSITSHALAGAFSFSAMSGDADSGISAAKTYTHAVDMYGQTPGVVINGVPFMQGGLSGGNYSFSTDGVLGQFTGYASGVGGSMGTLLSDFYYDQNAVGPEHLQLTGLTPGKAYTTNFYVAGFGPLEQTILASDYPVAAQRIPRDAGTAPGGIISYTYFAPASGTINFDITGGTGSFHQYGFTNELTGYVPLPQVFSTGVDSSNVPLPNGVADGHWTVQHADLNSGIPFAPIAATSAHGFPIGPWLGDNSTSAWVGPAADLIGPGVGSPYTYTVPFVTPSDGLVTIGGLAAADNDITGVFIDGVPGQFKDFGFDTWAEFFVSTNLAAGVHELQFKVTNADQGAGFTGFRADIGFAGLVPVPEPSTLALLGVAIVGFVGLFRRRA